MIGLRDSLELQRNIEILQRDGLARVKSVDVFLLLVRQNKNTCFCTVPRPTTNLNLTPPQKKKKQKNPFYRSEKAS